MSECPGQECCDTVYTDCPYVPDTPITESTYLDSAVYLASANKIFGTRENFILRFNASTGEFETAVKLAVSGVGISAYGPMSIAGAGSALYVSVNNSPSDPTNDPGEGNLNADVFPVDPTTLAGSAALGTSDFFDYGTNNYLSGPTSLLMINGSVFGAWLHLAVGRWEAGLFRVDPANPADHSDILYMSAYQIQNALTQFATDNQYVYYPDALAPGISIGDISTLEIIDSWTTADYYPVVGVEYALIGETKTVFGFGKDNYLYKGVVGNPSLTKITLSDYTDGTQIQPIHGRYKSGILYLPCQRTGIVLKYDVGTPANSTYVTGFDCPHDIVFAGSKVWAVQTGLVGLKEVV